EKLGPLQDEPAPFTRTGPGAGGLTKPDFVDYGGTMVFDAVARRLQTAPRLPTAGLITTNHDFLRQLLTSKSGTSFAAPMLANRAAQLVRRFPDASANLIKALLANSATVPEASTQRLSGFDARDQSRVHGNGLVDTLRAAFSDDHRVVYFAEDNLEMDHFAVYRVPIPAEFQTGGKRTIRVSLAYDPPVKRTRAEYTGTRMNFRLIRGCPVDHVFEHFRSRVGEGSVPPEMAGKYDCDLVPKKNARDKNTIQSASISFTADTTQYGEEYHLVVRCVGGWAMDQEIRQDFALVVELEHQAQVQLYARLRPRLRT
ncbi:S8 family serine peptidase, partial [Phaeobacter sp. B1627]|uniref:S8 family serine peptidase n=1 Tax=Phaeobacter sp. B1627 TaxID=2583809 RepID=UPI0011674DBE